LNKALRPQKKNTVHVGDIFVSIFRGVGFRERPSFFHECPRNIRLKKYVQSFYIRAFSSDVSFPMENVKIKWP
jgi:hypothetical protein